jgi:hypothetical protein
MFAEDNSRICALRAIWLRDYFPTEAAAELPPKSGGASGYFSLVQGRREVCRMWTTSIVSLSITL